jgi:hypothetical protein
MNSLSRIEQGRSSRPPRLLLYGVEGIGKSTFASLSPRPVFIQTEDGLDELSCDKFPLATCSQDVTAALGDLLSEEHDYQTVVIDSLDWLERLIWDRVCQDFGVKSIEKADGGYARGYMHALTYWREIVDQLTSLRSERQMAVILIAHSKVERVEDPLTTSYDRYSPRLHKHASALLGEWVDGIFFAHWKYHTRTEDTGFGRERSIAVPIGPAGDDRVLRTVGSPAWIAKNRFGLPAEIPLSWHAFSESLSG